MKISISNLSEGVHAFRLSAEPAHLGLGSNFTKEVLVNVTVEKTSKDIFLKAEATTSGTFTCDRCIDEFEHQLNVAYRTVYVFDDRDRARFPQQEVQVLSVGTTSIDLADDVRQFIMLAVPLKLLCKEKCAGLCPRCGTNWNRGTCSCGQDAVDSRWVALKKLKN